MSAIAKGYFDALVSLSGSPLFIGARQDIITRLSGEELKDIIQHGINEGVSRQGLKQMLISLLGIITEEPEVGAVPEEQVEVKMEDVIMQPQRHGPSVPGGQGIYAVPGYDGDVTNSTQASTATDAAATPASARTHASTSRSNPNKRAPYAEEEPPPRPRNGTRRTENPVNTNRGFYMYPDGKRVRYMDY